MTLSAYQVVVVNPSKAAVGAYSSSGCRMTMAVNTVVAMLLNKVGFQTLRQRGSHVILKHPDGRVTVQKLAQPDTTLAKWNSLQQRRKTKSRFELYRNSKDFKRS